MRTVGGTMVSRILGLSMWGGPLSAYFELTGHEDTTPRNTTMARGNALEESVLALWMEREGRDPESLVRPSQALRAARMPHAHATLDAYHVSLEAGRHVITIPDAKTKNSEEAATHLGPDGSDKVAVEDHLQLLWYMGVAKATELDVADEALLPTLIGPEVELQWAARLVKATGRPLALSDLNGTGLDFRIYHVAWDAALFAEVDDRVRRFLREHVEPGIPPEPGPGDLTDRDVRAVSRGIRAEKGRVLDFERLPSPAQALVLELVEAHRQAKEWDSAKEQASVRVKLAMGTADEIQGLPGGTRVTWRETSDGGRRFEIREPRRKR